MQTARRLKLEGLGVASETEADRARAQLSRDEARLSTAEADLQKAVENLGDAGRNNTGVRSAMAALEKARDDLASNVALCTLDGRYHERRHRRGPVRDRRPTSDDLHLGL